MENLQVILPWKEAFSKHYAIGVSFMYVSKWLGETARKIAETLANRSSPGTSGVIHVKSEAWNSRDGTTDQSQRTEIWGGTHSIPSCLCVMFCGSFKF